MGALHKQRHIQQAGELSQRILGPHGKRTAITYLIDDSTGRLTNTSAVSENHGELADLAYSYDPAGNLLRIADSPASAATDAQCYDYDQMRRLVAAWTPAGGDCGPSPTVAGLGGPAPYWHSWALDPTGNRLTQAVHAAGGNTTTSYAHPAAGSPRPHAVTSATTSGPGGSTLDTYAYDTAGNLTERVLAGESQQLTYDPEGGLASVTDTGGVVTSFLYDADRNRLIRTDPTGKTLYLPDGQELRWDKATKTTAATRYYTHIDTSSRYADLASSPGW